MEILTIDAPMLAKMFLAGAKNLESKKEWINELNVFPVPDGDTGTNMTMTIMAAAKEIAALKHVDMASVTKAISSGSLRGARGNSGVILSQLFRGFTKVVGEHETIDVVTLTEAMEKGVETAYKAVMKPKEGTILTVARGTANKGLDLVGETDDLFFYLQEVIKEAEIVLAKTPDMLPILKEAGVVDAGGQGLLEIFKGAFDALCGKEIDYLMEVSSSTEVIKITPQTQANIKFGYCTEFLIVLNKPLSEKQENEIKQFLENIGDSIVLVADDEVTKIHVHTNEPGNALQKALEYGSLSKIKIDNMREEHEEKLIKEAEKLAENGKSTLVEMPRKKMGFISVSMGAGLNEILMGLGVDYIIEGGQTMNPSTEDMLNAIDKVNADHIFILPNNSNIILAANQAASLTQDKIIHVIPTKTVPQGIVALINFVQTNSPEENEEIMTNELSSVATGQVTYAVRDTEIEGIKIHQNDFMGIGDSKILSAGTDCNVVIHEMIDKMVTEDSSIITIYYGIDRTKDEAQELASEFEEKYPDYEIEIYDGGQPIYYYIISVE